MDANKKKKLQQIGYRYPNVCKNCASSTFGKGQSWGTCHKHQYNHQKHTDAVRQLSVNAFGICGDHTSLILGKLQLPRR